MAGRPRRRRSRPPPAATTRLRHTRPTPTDRDQPADDRRHDHEMTARDGNEMSQSCRSEVGIRLRPREPPPVADHHTARAARRLHPEHATSARPPTASPGRRHLACSMPTARREYVGRAACPHSRPSSALSPRSSAAGGLMVPPTSTLLPERRHSRIRRPLDSDQGATRPSTHESARRTRSELRDGLIAEHLERPRRCGGSDSSRLRPLASAPSRSVPGPSPPRAQRDKRERSSIAATARTRRRPRQPPHSATTPRRASHRSRTPSTEPCARRARPTQRRCDRPHENRK